MPIDYKDYPDNWKEIRKKILQRAGDKCEECGIENYSYGYRNPDGSFYKLEGMELEVASLEKEKFIQIILTIAHLNHEPMDCRPENLKALCQRCHLNYDRNRHILNRKYGKRKDQIKINFKDE